MFLEGRKLLQPLNVFEETNRKVALTDVNRFLYNYLTTELHKIGFVKASE